MTRGVSPIIIASFMNILMAASEMAPFARSGSLADSVASLPAALQRRGHQVSVILPFYRSAREQKSVPISSAGLKFSVPVGDATMECEIFEAKTDSGIQVFFVGRDEFFDRSGLYGTEGRDYQDNAARFSFFAKCVVEVARRLDPLPDVIHSHDWQCGLVPVFAKFRNLRFPQILTVHDLGFQGNFWSHDFALTNLPADYFSPHGLEFFGSLNYLKGGIQFADRVIFASELFLSEAQEPGKGFGMEGLLREQRDKMAGIPDGVDDLSWNPESDVHLAKKFSASDLSGKSDCCSAILSFCNLKASPAGPVFVVVSRLLQSKGLDILLPALDRILAGDSRMIVAGDGDAPYVAQMKSAMKRHPGKLCFLQSCEEAVLHRVLAGGDILLAPAKLESSGIRTMQALKYGVVPVARASGGLRQIVEDYDPVTKNGNGFVFYDFTSGALVDCVRRAEECFSDVALWKDLVRSGMARDCSWAGSAESHEKLYSQLMG